MNHSINKSKIIKNEQHIIITSFMLILAILSSCNTFNEPIVESSINYPIPEAANAYAIEKETEIETIAPTEEHKPYMPYTMRPAREIYIGESQFMTRVNYIYNHVDDFKESKIIVEGMYGLYYSWDETFVAHLVYRNGPGDYGDDKFIGFYLEEGYEESLSAELHLNDWIRVKGTPYMKEHTDSDGEMENYMFLKVESIEVLPTRDRRAEMVND